MIEVFHLSEPRLEFAFGQKLETPKDGLVLFGPYDDPAGRSTLRLGIIGTSIGIGLVQQFLKRISGHIPGKFNDQGHPVQWAPSWPGFQACFGVGLSDDPIAVMSLKQDLIEMAIKKDNRADAVRSTVRIFQDAIEKFLAEEERLPDVWIVAVPDIVFKYGRPQVGPPPKAERTESNIISENAAKRFFDEGDLFPDTLADAEVYQFASNFHHQLKAELLRSKVAIQLVLESTLHDRTLLRNTPPANRKGLQDEASVAWNFATTLYFKMDAKPWALADVRPGVCYVGLVFKRDDTPAAQGEVCCAAQMFLNSGDGLVFRGALGPWYSEKSRDFHLSEAAAKNLMQSVIEGYKSKHGAPPEQLFIHGRYRFDEKEWRGFKSAAPSETDLIGVQIKTADEVRLFRPNASTPVLRGTAMLVSDRLGYLWSQGYVPRLGQYQGFETPKPLTVQISRGEADLKVVLADVLALTKVNYNACDFASGLPVTLKFADRIGDILMASPNTKNAAPLPFRYYI